MTAAGPQPPGEWQRLHPLSPLLRGGLVLLALLGYAASQVFDSVLASVGFGGMVPGPDLDEGPGGEGPFEQAIAHPLLALVALLLFLAVIALVNWVSWRFSRFRVGGGQVELRQGVLFRQHRQVRLERVQAVELSRPLLARMLGLARVVVQSAGGSDSTLTLSFVDLVRAEALREHLLDLAGRSDEATTAGRAAPTTPDAVIGAGHPVLEVPNGRLFVATILHGSTILLGVVVVGALLVAGVRSVGPLALAGVPALLPVAIAVGLNRAKELLTHGNFRLADAGTGVRVQEGLTDLRTTTIPLHRIQALELVQPLWWRPVGWWRIRVNVAGSGGSGDGEGERETTLLPVGTLDEALRVLGLLAPGVPAPGWTVAVLGDGPDPGWRGLPERARVLDPVAWRRAAWADAASAVLLRSGRLTRRAVAVPHARIQSVTLRQGWLQSRLRLATVHVVPAPGPVAPVLAHLDCDEAELLLADVTERARVARRRSGPRPGSLAPDPPGLVDWTRHPPPPEERERH
ncbi:PH domain-containing protein [Fodinibacter luteus]|uniref:PH domain-containing protein n=1 Tax=Fodinibacter luteus TaxID=552064 RepID=A0ABP8KAL6_9MICO